MSESSNPYQEFFAEVGKLNNHLRWLGDRVHESLGQTAAKRSLLLSLEREGPLTVPEMARERLVSRQIIQTQVNLLMEEGLVEARENPRHRRSKKMALTRKGRDMTEKMLSREAALLEDIGSPLSPTEVRQTSEALSKIRLRIAEGFDMQQD